MIVVGGWPGRNVVGLNGRFGVRPADFSTGGDFPNPFLDDVDAGDETTEFIGVVQSLPSSGAVEFTDLGGFSHTSAADGVYSTVFTLYTWAQGGPVTQHAPDETITTSFGAGFSVTGAGGIASTVAFGSATVTRHQEFAISAAGGIGSGEAFGAATVTRHQVFALTGVGGIASGEAFGTASVSFGGIFAVSAAGGIASGLALGTPTLNFQYPFAVSGAGGIASGEAFGTAVASFVGPFSVVGAGAIPSSVAFGVASVSFQVPFSITGAGGIASGEAFGAPVVAINDGIDPPTIRVWHVDGGSRTYRPQVL